MALPTYSLILDFPDGTQKLVPLQAKTYGEVLAEGLKLVGSKFVDSGATIRIRKASDQHEGDFGETVH
jgi:hypothetical protein